MKNGKLRSLEAVEEKFKQVKDARSLYHWKKQIETSGGSRNDKLLLICKATLAKFMAAKEKRLVIHDVDIRRRAMLANKDIGLDGFRAGRTWLTGFKQTNNIVSRKITKFVTRAAISGEADLIRSAREFVNDVLVFMGDCGPDNVYNTDQSGFNRKLHSGRTLEIKGKRTVQAQVLQISATTHSYTIVPSVSASGMFADKMLVVIQETGGQFGPTVKKNLLRAENLVVLASKSGKMEKSHLADFYKEVFLQSMKGDHNVLLVDSWPAFRDQVDLDSASYRSNQDLHVMTIPPGTTSMVKPWDVYGFRHCKNFVRYFSDRIIMDDLLIVFHQRNELIKLQSLLHNQLSSPRFTEMLKYGWYKAGYLAEAADEEKPAEFRTLVEFWFRGDAAVRIDRCEIEGCDEDHFISCGWCTKTLCFYLFYESYHYCNSYVQ